MCNSISSKMNTNVSKYNDTGDDKFISFRIEFLQIWIHTVKVSLHENFLKALASKASGLHSFISPRKSLLAGVYKYYMLF